jgi:DNA replication protein DnaC
MITWENKQQIDQFTRELRLPTFRREFESVAEETAREKFFYEDFLLRLMERELAIRVENRRTTQLHQPGFIQYKYLHDINHDDLPEDTVSKLPVLERLDFIKSGQNVIFSGNLGTEKTHLATALGILAC